MARGTTLTWLLAALWACMAVAQDENLTQYIGQLPSCGLTCIMQEVPVSACGSLLNTTCICSDKDLYAATQACVQTTCKTPEDAILTAQVEAQACQRPFRDRRADLFAPLCIEIPAVIAVVMRLGGRWHMSGHFEADDWIMLVCGILYLPFLILGQYAGQIAFGRDLWAVGAQAMVRGLKLFYVAESFYLVCLALTKISLLCFFLRIFPNKKFRWVTYGTMVVTGLSTTIIVFLQIFQCTPISAVWDGWKGHFGGHRCLNINALAFTAAGFAIGLDVVILVLPLPLLFGLNMSFKSKMGIAFMFSLGVFILITACIRLQYLVLFARSANPTWDYSDALIWSGLEVAVSIIVTSLPAIRVLLGKLAPGVFTTTGRSSGGASKSVRFTSSAKKSAFGTGAEKTTASAGGGGERHASQRDGSRTRFSVYRYGRGVPASESEEGLELGDRFKGDVHTEIGAASPCSSGGGRGEGSAGGSGDHGLRRHSSIESGIHVQTTTTIDSIRGQAF